MKKRLVFLMMIFSVFLWGCTEEHDDREEEKAEESVEEVVKESVEEKEEEIEIDVEYIEVEEIPNEPIEEPDVWEEENEEISDLPFFFPEGTQSVKYRADFLLMGAEGALTDKAEIGVTEVGEWERGKVYQLKIRSGEVDSVQDAYQVERFDLGYFFVMGDVIYYVKNEKADKLPLLKTEEAVKAQGTIVCQNEDKSDPIEGEKGWHEYIKVEGNRCEFHSWNDLVETGFYERFVWMRGKGLVQYLSGYGAASDGIELNMVR